ncbi:MAG TPA: hypothetical protein VLC46_18270 [Thermoanaerobaculia bacterium]|jgi:hypothetical protein|nr:hypothetical protein [Thermoanaerobaculia bacterium]
MSPRSVLPQSVYRRTDAPLPEGLRLKALEWALYFAVTGRHGAAELGRQMRAEASESDEALTRLMTLGLIEEQELDASEYVHALAAAGSREERTLREFLMAAAQPAADPVEAKEGSEARRAQQETVADSATTRQAVQTLPGVSPRPGPREVADITLHVPGATPRPRRTAPPAFGFKPLPSPNDDNKESLPMSVPRRLSLRALMNLIESQADSREAGQLDIYRVFVRIDTTLLKRNGIVTLRFTEDRLVSDPELEQALVLSLKKTLGLNCPENVWVEVA